MNNLRPENEIISKWEGDISCPLVSINCITYNHEKYIEDALKGFLIQNTNFPVEVLIHDDASTDKTAEIIRKYESLYPRIIKSIYQKENQWSKNKEVIRKSQYNRMKGKYIAYCEGDDFWTDPNKLQRQVDYMEENINCNVCGTRIKRLNQDNKNQIFTDDKGRDDISSYNYLDILYGRVSSHTSTNVIRRSMLKPYPIIEGFYNLDKILLMTAIMDGGSLVVLPQYTSVYRDHEGGVWSKASSEKRNKSYYSLFCAYKEVIPSKYHNHALRLRSYYATILFSISLKNFKFKQAFSYLRHLRPYPKNIKPFFKFLLK